MTMLRLLKFDAQEYATQTKSRTAETERAYIDGYPAQRWIYRLAASRYWWIRYYWKLVEFNLSWVRIGDEIIENVRSHMTVSDFELGGVLTDESVARLGEYFSEID